MVNRIIKMFAGGVIALTSLSVTALYLGQNRLVYPSWAQGARESVDTPDSKGIPYKDLKLTTKDGIELQAWDMRNEETKSKTTVIILCPNAGNIGYFIPIIEIFYKQLGLNVFIYSYRGYGYSMGTPSEEGLKLDADRVMSYLATDEFHKTNKFVLYGRSLGGANAIHIASKFYQLCDAVILENTFLSIRKVIPYIFPWLSRFAFMCHEVWDSESTMPSCNKDIPYLFLSGLEDEIVPPQHMKDLYEMCPSRNKQIYEFPFGTHNTTIVQDGYWDIVRKFLEENNFI
ncbi:hypothetical protein RNJ44_05040 [Nakaseomyces bracarensis]|uniref:AB hydrolase-1 domain-containing protein n=1 Tax=Nakaseomyces bracarensis TaxID=273131 RepID=A0ABR4NWK0_9SACH